MTSLFPDPLLVVNVTNSPENPEETDEWDMPTFAFHDLDYIPSGYGGILAPYIETGPGSKYPIFH